MVKTNILTNVSDIIDAFGGSSEMAKRYGLGTSAASNWRAAEEFPERLHYRISNDARVMGLIISPSVFESKAA